MVFFNGFMQVGCNTAKLVVLCERQGSLDVFIQGALILFERQGTVCVLLDELGGNGPLGPHRINRHEASLHIQEF